jgi:hypothetical protein
MEELLEAMFSMRCATSFQTKNVAMSAAGLDPRTTTLERASSNCTWQTRPLVREGAPLQQTRNRLTGNLVLGPRWGLIPRQTGRLTLDRNVTSTLTLTCELVRQLKAS